MSASSPSPAAGGVPASEAARIDEPQRDAAEEGDAHHPRRRLGAAACRTGR